MIPRFISIPNVIARPTRCTPAPSLILLDLMMPVMDGIEFRERQLADPEIREVPCAVMSADGHLSERQSRISAAEYIRKPIDIFKLLNSIEKYAR